MRTAPPPSRRPSVRAPQDEVRFRFQSAYSEEALKRRLEGCFGASHPRSDFLHQGGRSLVAF